MKPIRRRRRSITAVKLEQTDQHVEQILAGFNASTPFRRRLMLRQAGLPRSLYKYRALPPESDQAGRERFEQLLLHNQLWMSKVEAFNDPFEGQATYEVPYVGVALRQQWERKFRHMGFTSAQARAMVKSDDVARPERLAVRGQRALDIVLSKMGMCALSANPTSPLLWAHYAQSHTGVCVQLNPAADLDALLPTMVEYSEEYPVLRDILEPPEQRKVLPFLRKSLDWAYEREWRLIEQGRANFLRAFKPSAMGAVILGLRMSEADKSYVLDLMDQRERAYGVRPVIYQAHRHPRHYRLILKRLG